MNDLYRDMIFWSYRTALLQTYVNINDVNVKLTLKVPGREVEPGEGRDEEQGDGGQQKLPAPATHSKHPPGVQPLASAERGGRGL